MTWLLYQTAPNKQASAARELRRRHIEPYMLMAFPSTRVSRHAKAKRPNAAIKPHYLGPYVALDLSPEQEWLISRPDWLPVAIRPVPQPMGRRPVLTAAGVRFWTQPPRGLFRDVDVPRLREATGAHDFREGERVAVYSHGFQGIDADVLRATVVNGKIRVNFRNGMFETEAEVAAELCQRVA